MQFFKEFSGAHLKHAVLLLMTPAILSACGQSSSEIASVKDADVKNTSAAGEVLIETSATADMTSLMGLTMKPSQGFKLDKTGESLLISGPENAQNFQDNKGGVKLFIRDDLEKAVSGHKINIHLHIDENKTTAKALKVFYTTKEVGNSGWKEYAIADKSINFAYNVRDMKDGKGDDFIILPLLDGSDKTIKFNAITLSIEK